MSSEPTPDTSVFTGTRRVRVAHVLFLEIVGYSLGTLTAQARLRAQINAAVEQSPTFMRYFGNSSQLQLLPTSDGMAILFFEDVTAPAYCAIDITRAVAHLVSWESLPLKLRIGIHSGLVQIQARISGNDSAIGEGIRIAQRVASYGDAGKILLSAQYANWLQQFDEWHLQISPIGDTLAKHVQPLTLFNLHTQDFGKGETPLALQSVGVPAEKPRVVVLFRRNTEPDEALIRFLEKKLRTVGLSVFVAQKTHIGIAWTRQVEQHIRAASAVMAVVSPSALQSELLEFELEIAVDQNEKTGKPRILPICIGAEETLDGPVADLIAPFPQFRWNMQHNGDQLVESLLSAMREPEQATQERNLGPVGGAVPPDSPLYVSRDCDQEAALALSQQESILLLKGLRQVGKTSLMARCSQMARQNGWAVALTDFQKIGRSQLDKDDTFYRLLAATLARQLGFAYDFANDWDDLFGPSLNMEIFLNALLDQSETPLVWCLDEVDKLFTAPFASDFFGLVRSWHNSRSTEPNGPWHKLTVIIAYATEAHLFIQDLNQSPFNVGRQIDLEDFNLQQVRELNHRYGEPLTDSTDCDTLLRLIGGQPYLTRQSLDILATGKMDFAQLLSESGQDDGPFQEHLQRILASMSSMPSVMDFVREIIAGTATMISNRESYYHLLSTGIVRQNTTGSLSFRCELYHQYLSRHLR